MYFAEEGKIIQQLLIQFNFYTIFYETNSLSRLRFLCA